MCLRGDFTQGFCVLISTIPMLIYIMTGFPPPDRELRIWLLAGQRKQLDEERRLHGFIYALLTVTRRHLKTLEREKSGETSHNRLSK